MSSNRYGRIVCMGGEKWKKEAYALAIAAIGAETVDALKTCPFALPSPLGTWKIGSVWVQ